MNKLVFTLTMTMFVGLASVACAQKHHSDIEFGFNDISDPTAFIIEGDNFTKDGFRFFESEMEEDAKNPGNYGSDEPGFDTNPDENLFIREDDQIWLRSVDASQFSNFGMGYVNYYNPDTDSVDALWRIGISDNTDSTNDLILNGAGIESGDNPQFIGAGDGLGELHRHLEIDLLDDATTPFGAYGIMFRLETDLAPVDGTMDFGSDTFWVIWNHGMSEEDFENRALRRFGVSSVPEPTSVAFLLLAGATTFCRRRRNFQS